MRRIIVLCIVIMGLATNGMVSYEGYKVFRVFPEAATPKKGFSRLYETFRNKFIYWKEPIWTYGEALYVMISPEKLQEFYDVINLENLENNNTIYQIIISNVQELIDVTMPQNQSQGFDFLSYHTLEEIYDYLDELARKNLRSNVVVGGKTYEGREIKGIRINNGYEKAGIFIGGGMHARVWISPATVMYILHQLCFSNDKNVRYIADNHNWFIFPIFNPDGYAFTYNKTHGDRLWKKTRKPSSLVCIGSDPDRNWSFKWHTSGVSNDPCSEIYPGSGPFSEIEMKTISQYIKYNLHNFDTYIMFNSFGELLLFPYAYTNDRSSRYDELKRVGKKAINNLKKRYNTTYWTGCISEYSDGLASGLSVDYVAGVLHKPVVYQYLLRDRGLSGWLLPPNQIIPTGEETLDSLITIIHETMIH